MKTCRNCTEYRHCAKGLKQMGINPDDPNNEAIQICVRFRPKKTSEVEE